MKFIIPVYLTIVCTMSKLQNDIVIVFKMAVIKLFYLQGFLKTYIMSLRLYFHQLNSVAYNGTVNSIFNKMIL